MGISIDTACPFALLPGKRKPSSIAIARIGTTMMIIQTAKQLPNRQLV
jgi:hypothetical protein